jgi:hypothetical protein
MEVDELRGGVMLVADENVLEGITVVPAALADVVPAIGETEILGVEDTEDVVAELGRLMLK